MVSLWRNNDYSSPWQRSHRSPQAAAAASGGALRSHGWAGVAAPWVGSTPPPQHAPVLSSIIPASQPDPKSGALGPKQGAFGTHSELPGTPGASARGTRRLLGTHG